MMKSIRSRLIENTLLAITGGRWTNEVAEDVQRNLRWFFLDGVLGASLDGIVTPYFSLYLLALGASSGQIGLMISLAGINATLMLLPGALLSERTGNRKLIFALCGAGIARLSILVSALLPAVFATSSAIYGIIVLKILADGLGNFSGPAWTSLAGDIVPLKWRGRYFGGRNFAMSISSMAATFLAGNLIAHFTSITGYQVAFSLAFMAGFSSTAFFWQIKEPKISPQDPNPGAYTLRAVLRTISSDLNFRNYTFFGIIWNLAVGLSLPYFVLFMAQDLQASPTQVGVYTIVASLAGLPVLRLFGHLVDRWGAKKAQLATGFILPLVPLAWMLARNPLHGILINLLAGMLWAGFNLAAFNFLLNLAPAEKLARYAALSQLAVSLSSATGTFLASRMIPHLGYVPAFLLSGLVGFVAILIYWRFVHQ